jgi:predicted DCC family thiol-disulfide oxidoreductase YuxK
MKFPMHTKKIEVYYDGRCGMCCTFHEWINRQPRAFEIDFIPYQSPEAEKAFPGVSTLDPAREMIVRTDDGVILRGAEAWVWCLHSCANCRDLARNLAQPAMLAVAIKMCRLLAANRHGLSKIFFHRKDREVRETLHLMTPPECDGDTCATDHDEWRAELMH